MPHLKNALLAGIAALCVCAIPHSEAGPAATASLDKTIAEPAAQAEESVFDKIWGLATLYKNDSNPFLEEIDFTGRYQGQYYDVESRKGDNAFFETRRFRLGLETALLNRHLIFKADLDTNLRQYGADSVFYNRMTALYMKIHVNDSFNLTIGKQEPHFGYDRMQSDTLQPFFERSFFDDQFMPGPDYASGVTFSGKVGQLGYLASVYSNNVDKEFGRFNGGQSEVFELTYDFAKAFNCNRALWAIDYLHVHDITPDTNIFQSFHNGAATYFDFKKDRFGFVTQLAYGNGVQAKGDIYELMLLSTYDVTKKLQVVARYQLGWADEDKGITTLNRQEKTIGKFTGDQYQAGYLGANYFIYGNKLKLMGGVQYASLDGGTGAGAGYSGWTLLTGVRVFW